MFAALIEERGVEPMMSLLEDLGGWPIIETLPSRKSNSNFDLIELLAKLRLINNRVLVNVWVSSDDKNSSMNTIHVSI